MLYQSLRRTMSRATKLVRQSSKVALALQKLAVKAAKPVVAKAKPRIAAAKTTPAKVTSAKGSSFRLCPYPTAKGDRSYRLYLPASAGQAAGVRPLLIMLHGCGQTPTDFATGTRMNRLADDMGFIVVYPTQTRQANRNKCWNWYRDAKTARDGDEPAMIVGMTQDVMAHHRVDRSRVYIAGFSAGGAAAVSIAAAYPMIYAAVGVHSGLPVGAANSGLSALVAMRAGSAGVKQSAPMPTIIFHGDKDEVVNPRNGRAIAARAVATFPALTEMVKNGKSTGGYRKTAHRGSNRKSYCEYWSISGAGHAWSGGNPAGSFAQASGPDASREMIRFFKQHRLTVTGVA